MDGSSALAMVGPHAGYSHGLRKRRAMFRHYKIRVSRNGPYLVPGSVPLAVQTIGANGRGESTEWVEGGDSLPASAQFALCRCGESQRKSFCDGTHAKIGFDHRRPPP